MRFSGIQLCLAVLVLAGCATAPVERRPETGQDRAWPVHATVLVPAGSLVLGDTHSDLADGSKPKLALTFKPFRIGACEISFGLWNHVREWADGQGYAFDNDGTAGRARDADGWPLPENGRADSSGQPVTAINWFDAVKWCNAFSEFAGRKPCYYTDATRTTVYRRGRFSLAAACLDPAADGYRLPTEAEWEWAARGAGRPLPAALHFRGRDTQDTIAWQSVNRGRGTEPVAETATNQLGIRGMNGNVWEWVFDSYGSYRARDAAVTGNLRVLRGFYHDCYGYAGGISAALRLFAPDLALDFFGFRIVLAGTNATRP